MVGLDAVTNVNFHCVKGILLLTNVTFGVNVRNPEQRFCVKRNYTSDR
jgi:hypothetical protein